MTTTLISAITFGRLAAGVPVRDIQAACAFYSEVLGFQKVFENGDPVGFMILKKDAAELHLNLKRDHRPSTLNVGHLMVDDVDALHGVCQAAGVRIIKSLADKDYGLRTFVFADPDGNRIDVGQPSDLASDRPAFENQNLKGAHFKDCALAGARFEDADFSGAVFSNASLKGARLENVSLAGVSIDNANIDGLTIFGHDIQALIRAELARRRG
jgi:catechol 2,3-dioxygenase-like lactoylglutathione lyase family enzyme